MAKKIFGKFKVLRGVHSEGGKIYNRGDIVESMSDLLKHNHPGSIRFAGADDVVPSGNSVDEDEVDDAFYEDMSMEDLKLAAKDAGISVSSTKNKSDIIDLLKKAEA